MLTQALRGEPEFILLLESLSMTIENVSQTKVFGGWLNNIRTILKR